VPGSVAGLPRAVAVRVGGGSAHLCEHLISETFDFASADVSAKDAPV
jgi:hypothetical protein